MISAASFAVILEQIVVSLKVVSPVELACLFDMFCLKSTRRSAGAIVPEQCGASAELAPS